jgi:hypothetical protein
MYSMGAGAGEGVEEAPAVMVAEEGVEAARVVMVAGVVVVVVPADIAAEVVEVQAAAPAVAVSEAPISAAFTVPIINHGRLFRLFRQMSQTTSSCSINWRRARADS